MMTEKINVWFSSKRAGSIYRPCCWQGWVTLILFASLMAAASWFVPQPGYIACVAILSIGLVAICLWKGETPNWYKEP